MDRCEYQEYGDWIDDEFREELCGLTGGMCEMRIGGFFEECPCWVDGTIFEMPGYKETFGL